jgi:uncharacterized cupredoxin-like copper-binding protein
MRRPFAVAATSWALLAIPLTLVFLVAVAAVTPEDLPGGVVFELAAASILALPLGLAVRRWRWPLYPAAAVSFLLTLIGLVSAATFPFGHPERFFDLAMTIAIALGPPVALVGSIAAIRRKDGSRGKRPALAALAAGLAAIAASGIFALVQGPIVVRASEPADVLAQGDLFLPTDFSVTAGDRVTFHVRNEDSWAHTFSIDELAIDRYVGPMADPNVTFTVDAPAGTELELYCAINGHEDMVGTIHVDEASET